MCIFVTVASKTLPSPTAVTQPGEIGPTHEGGNRSTGDSPTIFEHQDMRREPHDIFKIMGDEDERHVQRPSQAVDLALKVPANGSVDSGERFIQKQHGWFTGQRSCQRDALPLATRQFVGLL